MPTTKTRRTSRSNHSHTLSAEANRHIVQPAKRSVRSASRKMKRTISDLPTWLPWAAGVVGIAAIIYAVSKSEAVQDFFTDMSGNDFFEEEEEFGSNNTSNSNSSDYGFAGAGGL